MGHAGKIAQVVLPVHLLILKRPGGHGLQAKPGPIKESRSYRQLNLNATAMTIWDPQTL
jgi:hypothetical protein